MPTIKAMNGNGETDRFKSNRRDFVAATAAAAVIGLATTTSRAAERKTDPFTAVREVLRREEPTVWVFTGDSITHGAKHTLGWRSYPEHFAERLRWELRRVRDLVINTGISGDVVPGVLNDFDWRVAQFKPAVVSLMFGMNDSDGGPGKREAFRRAYLALIAKIRSIGALPLLNTTNTILGGRDDIAAYNEVIRDVAVATNAPLVDHYAHWQKSRPTNDKLQSWIEDRTIHPGVFGHRAFAQLIFDNLGIFDATSPTCQLPTS